MSFFNNNLRKNKETFDYESLPKGYYDDIYRRRKGIRSRWHHDRFLFMSKKIPNDCTHLDLACGSGTFVGHHRSDSKSIRIGIDISLNQLHAAHNLYSKQNIHFVNCSVDHLPFRDCQFEVVTSLELIEHLTLAQSEIMLKEIYRVLRPGGTIVLSTPNYSSLWPYVEWLLNKVSDISYIDQHITKFNSASLCDMLIQTGYTSIRVQKFMLASPFLAVFGWRFSNYIRNLEPQWLMSQSGLLLSATGTKR